MYNNDDETCEYRLPNSKLKKIKQTRNNYEFQCFGLN